MSIEVTTGKDSADSVEEASPQDRSGRLWKIMLSTGLMLLIVGIPLFADVLLLPKSEIPHFMVPGFVYFVMVFCGILLVYRSLVFTRHAQISVIGQRIEILILQAESPAFAASKRIVGKILKEIADTEGTKHWIIRLRPRKERPRFIAVSYAGETVTKGIMRRIPRVVVEIQTIKDPSLIERDILDSEALSPAAIGEVVVISQW